MRGHEPIPGRRQHAAERLDQLLALPMLVVTVVFLAVLVMPVVFPDLPTGVRVTLEATDLGIWAAFLAEYLARLFLAPDRPSFIRRNVFDLLLVVIPVLRPLRLLRSVRLIAPPGSPGSAQGPAVWCGKAGYAWPAVPHCWHRGQPRS